MMNGCVKLYKEEIQFFKNVMIYLGHHNWVIEFKNDSYRWKSKKIITIDYNYNGDLKQIILHEITHIGTARFSNQKHNPQFWKHLEYLTRKFLKKELDDIQIYHKEFMTIGYYSFKYL